VAEPTFNDFPDLIRPELDRRVETFRKQVEKIQARRVFFPRVGGRQASEILDRCVAVFDERRDGDVS
jgi:hypothetical protein